MIINPVLVFAQSMDLKTVKNFYCEQAEDSCVKFYNDQSVNIDQVVLIRHGKPNLSKKGWFNRDKAKKYVHDYDSVPIIPFQQMPVCMQDIPTDTIYSSSIPRASSTAHLIFGDEYEIVEDYRFREFERKIMNFCNMKLPLGFWTTFSRGLWLMGLNDKGIESFRDAKKRTKENADLLIDQASSDHLVILVAHGFHNKYVIKYLKKRGWTMVRKGGRDYGAVNIMAKEHPTK